jgi:hypothetical protein
LRRPFIGLDDEKISLHEVVVPNDDDLGIEFFSNGLKALAT